MWRLTRSVVFRVLRALAYGLAGSLALALVLFVRFLDARPDLEVWHLAELDAAIK